MSPGLERFDPFWQRVTELGIPVCMHASDSGYSRYVDDWEPSDEMLPFQPKPFRMALMHYRAIQDTFSALILHGALSRFPEVRIAAVENGSRLRAAPARLPRPRCTG